MRVSPFVLVLATAAAFVPAVACSDEGAGAQVDREGGDAGGGEGPPGSGPDGTPGAPVYAVITQVFAPEGQTSYIALTSDLTTARHVGLEGAVEYPGRGVGAALVGQNALYVGGNESGTVTRFDLSADGRTLTPSGTVGFSGLGVTTIGEYSEQFQFVSPTKAYYFDGRSAQMIVWNPTEMTAERAVDLSSLALAGAIVTFSTNALRRGDEIALPLGWRSDVDARIPSEAGVLLVNTKDDSVRVLRDGRCGYVRTAVQGEDGRLYLATEAYGSAVHRVVPANAPAPCLLRLEPEWTAFDTSFHVPLSGLVGGATAGTLLPGATPGSAWLRVLDEATTSVGNNTNPRLLASTAAWAWWTITLGDTPVATAQPLGVSNGSDFLLNAEHHALIPEFSGDRSQTSFRDWSEGTPGDSMLSIPGLVFSVARLR